MTFLEAVAWLLVLIGTIWTGMFTRYVGQLLIDWSKQPNEEAKQAKAKKNSLEALRATVGNAKQYCEQMSAYLAGLPYNNEAIDEQLKEAAVTAGKMPIVPTFNLDTQILESFATSLFGMLDLDKAQKVMTTRLEIRHLQRRIDTVAEMVFLRNTSGKLTPLQTSYIEGTRHIVNTTVKHCAETLEILDQEIIVASITPTRNLRPWGIVVGIILLIAAFVWATTFIDGVSINLKRTREDSRSNSTSQSELPDFASNTDDRQTPVAPDVSSKTPNPESGENSNPAEAQGERPEEKP